MVSIRAFGKGTLSSLPSPKPPGFFILVPCGFEWVATSISVRTGWMPKNSPRRARRTRRTEFDPSCSIRNQSFRQPHRDASASSSSLCNAFLMRSLRLCERHKLFLSPVRCTHSSRKDRQEILVFTLCVLRALGGESFCFARRRDWWNGLLYPLETTKSLYSPSRKPCVAVYFV